MRKSVLILNILNLLQGVLVLLFLNKILFWIDYLNEFNILHLIILTGILSLIKSWIESKYNVQNPLKKHKSIKIVYYIGGGVFLLGYLFNILHWPGENLLLLVGAVVVFVSLIMGFFIDDERNSFNPDVLDDI